MQMSLFGGVFLRLGEDGTPVPVDDPRFGAGTKRPWAAEVNGFNVHAGVMVRAGDREGLERLCRYVLRHVDLEDVVACPCGGRRRIIADVEEPSAIEAILSHLGLPTTAPPVARARSPARAGEAA